MRDFIVFLQEDENFTRNFGLFGKKCLDLAIYSQVFLNPYVYSLLIISHSWLYYHLKKNLLKRTLGDQEGSSRLSASQEWLQPGL